MNMREIQFLPFFKLKNKFFNKNTILNTFFNLHNSANFGKCGFISFSILNIARSIYSRKGSSLGRLTRFTSKNFLDFNELKIFYK